jgi:hypothetical protein
MTHEDFVAVVSHELRGAIGAINAAAQVLEGCDPSSAMAAEARGVIARQSQRLASALDDVQQLGRMVGPAGAPSPHAADLAALLRECGAQVEPGQPPVAIRTDAAQLQDAIARTIREAPSRPRARFGPGEKEAATLFTLEPVGGGFGVQFLRALLERAGAQACFLQGAEGRRFEARLPH